MSLAAQVGKNLFFDKNLSSGKNMSCASCHDPAYAYGPPNSLAVQLGSDPTQSGARAVPSLRYKSMTPTYSDAALNPDKVSLNAPGGGFMWDGRADTLTVQATMPLLNPVEMNTTPAAIVQTIQTASYAPLFQQAFGANALSDVTTALGYVAQAIQAFESEDPSFLPYSSKYDRYLEGTTAGALTAAETRGLSVFRNNGNCAACHYTGLNYQGSYALFTDFTYQAIGAPRNDNSIPNNPDPIPLNANSSYYDMGLCGPARIDHLPSEPGSANAYCGLFKVPTLRNIATRTAFLHNGVFHSLTQVVNFYNTRDTNPEYWYPSSGGDSSKVTQNPSYALFPSYAAGATIATFNDLPAVYQVNVDEEQPMGTATSVVIVTPTPDRDRVPRRKASTGTGSTTSGGSSVYARPFHSTPAMSAQDVSDLVCFLNTLTDGYQPPATTPASGTCVN